MAWIHGGRTDFFFHLPDPPLEMEGAQALGGLWNWQLCYLDFGTMENTCVDLLGLLQQMTTHWGLKTTDVSSLPVLEARSLKSSVGTVGLPLEALREGPSCLFSFWWPQASLSFDCITPDAICHVIS